MHDLEETLFIHILRELFRRPLETLTEVITTAEDMYALQSASVNKGLTKTLICDLSRTLKDVSIFIEFSMRDKNCPNLSRDLEISVARSCPILCEPMDCNPPGTSVHGILQARRLEWVAMPPSRGIFPTQGWNPHLLHWQADPLSSEPYGKPKGGGGLGDTPHIPPCLLGSVPGSLLSRSGDGS